MSLWVNRIIVLTGSVLVAFHCVRKMCMIAIYIGKQNILALAVDIHDNARCFAVFSHITYDNTRSLFGLYKIAEFRFIGDFLRFLCLRLCRYGFYNFLKLLFLFRLSYIDICDSAFKRFTVFRFYVGFFLAEASRPTRYFPCYVPRIVYKVIFKRVYSSAFSFAENDNIGSDIGTFKSPVRKPPRLK